MQILLPSGAYLSLGAMLTSVRLFASSGDRHRTSGLCGTFNGRPGDDMTMPGGELADCGARDRQECHNWFASRWR